MNGTIYIFGAGPTGLSLAWLLSKKGNRVTVIEKYNSAGGTWATRWTENDLFTQHSPQILTTAYINTIALWEEMGINYREFTKGYNAAWISLILNNTSSSDKLKLVSTFLSYTFRKHYYEQLTVKQQFYNNLSVNGWNAIVKVCYLLDGVPPDIMTVAELFGSFDQTVFYSTMEMKKASDDRKGFAQQWVDKLKKQGVKFRFNTSLKMLKIVQNTISVYVQSKTTPEHIKIEGGKMILALDPLSLLKVLSVSDDSIKNNWGTWNKLYQHISRGIYISIGVQYHFSKNSEVKLKGSVKSGFGTEWGIICIKIPGEISEFFVISCSVINLDSYSTSLKKTVRECNPEEVKQEVWRQLVLINPLPEYKYATLGTDVEWSLDNGWNFDISSACRTVQGPINSHGKRNDLAIVGPLNYRIFKPTTMEAAVETALRFVGGDVRHAITLSSIIRTFVFFIIVFVVAIIMVKFLCLY